MSTCDGRLTARQVAEILRVDVITVRRWFREGRIKGSRNDCGQICINHEEVDRILQGDGMP